MAVDFSNMTPEQQQQFLVEQGRLREQIETEAKRQEAMRRVLQIARQRGYLDPRDVDNFGLDYDEVNSLFRAGQIKPISTPVPSQPPVYDGFGGIKARREAMESSSPVEPKQTSGSTDTTVTSTGRSTGSRVSRGSYATPGQPTGGTYSTPKPTPMYNPDNVSLAYSLSNTPVSKGMQDQALIDKWNREHGISYATGKDGLIYRTDPQHPNGYVDPFKNDLSKTGSTGYATGKGMLTSSSDGTYATGEGIKDANGNVLTNPGGDWEYQYALKNPEYGLGMTGKMSDAQRNYLQAVSDNMGYKYNFTGAPRYV